MMHLTKGKIQSMKTNSVAFVIMALLLIALNGKHVDSSSLFPIFNNFMLFPRIRCTLAFLRLDFKIEEFDRYEEYFRNDSVMILAQTGEYIGANGIEEYVKFANPAYTPFVGKGGEGRNTSSFVQYKDGQCEFLAFYYSNYTNDTATATDLPSPSYGVTAMIKLYFDFRSRFIRRANVFYSDIFTGLFFSKILNSVPSRQYICGVMEGPCGTILNMTSGNASTCETTLNLLPPSTDSDVTNDTGVQNYVDGNSQGCRAVHAVLADSNPINHCAHLSFTPMKDPKGNIKCQTSKHIKISDLFTTDDIERYNEFAESQGVDPTLGHTLVGYSL